MRSRWLLGFAFIALAIALSIQGTTRGQAGGKIRADVRYIDPADGKEASADFEVKGETPAGIELITGGGPKVIPPDQIVTVTYRGLPGITLDQLTRLSIEEEKDAAAAAQQYADLAAKASGPTKRVLEFRGAMNALKVTNAKKGADFEAEAEPTAKRLAEVGTNNATSWEVWPAFRAAARLHMELGQFDEAAQLLGKLAATPNLPNELRREAALLEARTLLRAGKAKEANGVLANLAKEPTFPRSGELRQILNILQIAATAPAPDVDDGKPVRPTETITKLEDAIEQATEPRSKAIGRGVLGDLYILHGFPRDAMWAYLWVDVVYPGAKDEQVIAVRRLAAVFDQMGEKERADEFREKLVTIR